MFTANPYAVTCTKCSRMIFLAPEPTNEEKAKLMGFEVFRVQTTQSTPEKVDPMKLELTGPDWGYAIAAIRRYVEEKRDGAKAISRINGRPMIGELTMIYQDVLNQIEARITEAKQRMT